MFVVLDTNHFTELTRESAVDGPLSARLVASNADVFVTVITAHEALGGWLALVNRHPAGGPQVHGYLQLRRCLNSLAKFDMLDFDAESVTRFDTLKKQLPRIGSMDLKLAAICLAHDATLLTRNTRDFESIKDLRIENWLD